MLVVDSIVILLFQFFLSSRNSKTEDNDLFLVSNLRQAKPILLVANWGQDNQLVSIFLSLRQARRMNEHDDTTSFLVSRLNQALMLVRDKRGAFPYPTSAG